MSLTFSLLTLIALSPVTPEQTPWALRSLTLPGRETFTLGPRLLQSTRQRPTLRLGTTRFEGHTGCNAISGRVRRAGGHLTLRVERQTALPCPDHVLSLEADFLRLLQGPLRPEVQGRTLTLTGEAGGRLAFGAVGFEGGWR